ncbi:hypothetical protein JCM6882_009458 [Rhodosporidiobolus microsporus]
MSGISFRIQAPSRPSSASAPPSRPSSAASRARPPHSTSHRDDDDDDEEEDEGAFGAAGGRDRKRPRLDKGDEEVVEFGRNGATSKNPKAAPSGPLVIAALPNKDWRKAAEELRAGRNIGGRKKKEMYIPEASGGMKMAGSGGGQGGGNAAPTENVDKMNTEEVVGGLEQPTKKTAPAAEQEIGVVEEKLASRAAAAPQQPETEEQRALRELLGEEAAKKLEPAELDAIVSAADARGGPVSEEQAFKKDLESRPDEASLDDYARVPVGQFGLAMLRGMGWQPGQAASRTGRGVVEAHVPSSRPALLGIGAKPMAEAMGDAGAAGGKDKKGGSGAGQTRRRDDMKFVPLMKRERERIEGPGGGDSGSGRTTNSLPASQTPITNGSASSSRRSSRSPPPSSSSSRRDRDRDDRDRDRERDRRRYDDDRSSSRRDRDREYDSSSSRRDRDRERGSSRRAYDDDARRSSSRRDYDDDRRGGGGSSSSKRDEERRSGPSRYEDDRRDRRRDDDRDRGSSRRY